MNFKKYIMAGLACFGLATVDAVAAISTDDYVEAAWMTTRFYGAQRSGQGPNWLADGTKYTTSFTKDSYMGKDVSGGWFDCGDHAMFAQTQGYASYILALAYAEFTQGFYDLYTGDYTDYKANNNYSRAGGKPNKLRDLLEELRYEADFWVKAAPDDNTFISIKGDGNYDHKKWVTPGFMSTLGTENGGDPRPITANKDDSYSSGMAAAMLAVMARMDPDQTRQATYLKAAKHAYAYSASHTGVASCPFYDAAWWGGRTKDGHFLAALELYRTTKDESYKNDAQSVFNQLKFQSGTDNRLEYANPLYLSVIMGEAVLDLKPNLSDCNNAISYINKYYDKQKNANGVHTKGGYGFPSRNPSGAAFLYALYSKFNNTTQYDAQIEKDVSFLMGENEHKKSYIVGFTRNNTKAPQNPHHRGYYANEDIDKNPNSSFNVPEKNKLLGGVIPGNFENGEHSQSTEDVGTNEVCIDINAPMVGALGYILSKKAPKTDADLGTPVPGEIKDDPVTDDDHKEDIPTKDPSQALKNGALNNSFFLSQNGMNVSIANNSKGNFKVQVFDMMGNRVQELQSNGSTVSLEFKTKGVFMIKVLSGNAKQIYSVKIL